MQIEKTVERMKQWAFEHPWDALMDGIPSADSQSRLRLRGCQFVVSLNLMLRSAGARGRRQWQLVLIPRPGSKPLRPAAVSAILRAFFGTDDVAEERSQNRKLFPEARIFRHVLTPGEEEVAVALAMV
jgi:hypothetical protein